MVLAMSLLLMVIAAAATVSEAQLLRTGRCPMVTSMPNLNVSMLMGTWYEQVHTKRWAGMELQCNTMNLIQNSPTNFSSDGFTYSPTIERIFYEYRDVVITPIGNASQKNYVLDLSGDDPMSCVFLLGTDYVSFATLFTCTNLGEGLHAENVLVYTREKKAKSSDLLSGIRTLNPFNITVQYLEYTRQKKCPTFSINDMLGNTTMPAMPGTPPGQVSMGTTPGSMSGAPAMTTSGSPNSKPTPGMMNTTPKS